MLTAGGSGGHLFPAQSLASELNNRGFGVDLITDDRAYKFGQNFPAATVHVVASGTIRKSRPLSLFRTAAKLFKGYRQSVKILRKSAPKVVAGFGGYPTLPPMFAARRIGIPTILHEANSVMGRANRILAGSAAAVAISFPSVKFGNRNRFKQIRTGTPIRKEVLDASTIPYKEPGTDGQFNLLVFGGSQGAKFLSDMMPKIMASLPGELRRRTKLVQQCRREDMEALRGSYETADYETELGEFFDDLPMRIAQAHLVVCRSGAATLCELAAIGRPAILVPLPNSRDADQAENAMEMEASGGAIVALQESIVPEELAETISNLIGKPGKLAELARQAKLQGNVDATDRLADLVEHVARGGSAVDYGKGVET